MCTLWSPFLALRFYLFPALSVDWVTDGYRLVAGGQVSQSQGFTTVYYSFQGHLRRGARTAQ